MTPYHRKSVRLISAAIQATSRNKSIMICSATSGVGHHPQEIKVWRHEPEATMTLRPSALASQFHNSPFLRQVMVSFLFALIAHFCLSMQPAIVPRKISSYVPFYRSAHEPAHMTKPYASVPPDENGGPQNSLIVLPDKPMSPTSTLPDSVSTSSQTPVDPATVDPVIYLAETGAWDDVVLLSSTDDSST